MAAKSGLMFFTYGKIKQIEKNALIYLYKIHCFKGIWDINKTDNPTY